jgi:hypothetical protein
VARRTNYGFQKQQRDQKTQKKREAKDEKKRLKQEAVEGQVALPADPEHDEKA